MDTIRMLCIAPYPEMEPLVREAARAYDNVELSTFTGFYLNAVQFAKAFPDKEFDVIISRGGTASLLSGLNETPVVEIEISTLDLLRVITQARQLSPRAAVVSYRHITREVETLARFLRVELKTYPFDDAEQIEETVARCVAEGCDLIVGGAATRAAAQAAGARFLLITSSRESVEESIRRAMSQVRLVNDMRDANRLFQTLIDRSAAAVFLMEESGELRYLNVAARRLLSQRDGLEQLLAGQIEILQETGRLHQIKRLGGDTYEINGGVLPLERRTYYQFELRFRSAGYRAASFAHVEGPEELRRSRELPGSSELYLRPIAGVIGTARSSQLPVLIQGEAGTCKGQLARLIHSDSAAGGSALLRLSCGEMTEKSWLALLGNLASPLHATGYTVYLENVEALSAQLQQQLAAYIEDTKMSQRHRLLSSSTRELSAEVAQGRFSARLYLLLSGITVTIPPLAQRREDLPALVQLLIPQFNAELGKTVVGMEPEAVELLKDYDWPLNLRQLEKVLRQIMAASEGFYLSAEETAAVLRGELRRSAPAPAPELTGTLEEIERRVIEQVLREENMNQSAAARRLGIGRSTLWRKLGREREEE